jgi:hypothetical protein
LRSFRRNRAGVTSKGEKAVESERKEEKEMSKDKNRWDIVMVTRAGGYFVRSASWDLVINYAIEAVDYQERIVGGFLCVALYNADTKEIVSVS